MAIFKKQYTKPLPRGAEVFTRDGQRYARWADRNGRTRTAKVTAGRDGSTRIMLETRTLTVRIREASGVIRQVSSGCRTRSAAEGVLAGLRKRRERIKAGVVTQEEETASGHAVTAIADHVDGYLAHLALAVSPEHLANITRQLARLTAECRVTRLADLSGDRLERWLGQRRQEGMGPRTMNTYLAALRSFAAWCIDSGRLLTNPFIRVQKADERADQRHQRRALTSEEIGRLLVVARLRPVAEYGRTSDKTYPAPEQRKRANWQRTPLTFESIRTAYERGRAALLLNSRKLAQLDRRGQERELVYKTLLLTGLRLGELSSITVGQVDLNATPAVLVLNAADEKNRQGSIIPLRNDLAAEIRGFIANHLAISFTGGKGAGLKPSKSGLAAPLFDIPRGLSNVINRDLLAAGIPKRDSRNRVVDVHALRHTFGTNLSRAGVPLRTAQAAMRHSDPRLTANVYTDPMLLDVAGAVNALPALAVTTAPISGAKVDQSSENNHGVPVGVQAEVQAMVAP